MPIKRHPSIIELSRDHHFGLLFCWKIKEGLQKNISVERINKYISFFWDNHLSSHFLEEEALLFNKVEDSLCDKAMEEHKMIKDQISSLLTNKNNGQHDYIALADLINAHIRFEERVLFPHLEVLLSDEQLNEIGEYLTATHSNPFVDDFEDEFWVPKKKNE